MNQDLPGIIDRPSAWVGKDMAAHPESWCYRLSEADLADLEQAACHFLSLGRDIGQITARDFPLQHFGEQIASLSNELLHGCGFRLLRGLPIAGYSRELAATIFSGIGVWLGCPRSQNAQGHLLGHVRDIGLDPAASTTRIYQTSVRQTFHTDSADVVGLLCLQMARRGGESLLVSAETLYNEMLKRHPELVPALFEVVATDRRGEVPDGEDPWFEIPVLNWHAGFLTVQYQRQYVDSAQRFATAPRLRAQQVDALDCFDNLANDPGLHLAMRLQPGDMQFVYNHALLHDRSAFEDWPDPTWRRHLLRLWLSMPGDRPLPACFAPRYGSLEVGKRGGIITAGTQLHAPLD